MWWTLRNTSGDMLRHMQVWDRDDGSLQAVVFLDPPSMGDVIVAPDSEAAFDEALDWLEGEHRDGGSGELQIVVLDGDVARADTLRRRAYSPTAAGNVRLWRRLDSPPASAPLPEGFRLGTVTSDLDFEQRAYVEASSFDSPAVTGAFWREMVGRLPGYRPDLDVVAVAPDGRGASACTCFIDAATSCGEFEVVGTTKDSQRRGVGKAVISEGLRRLHDAGARLAIVETTTGNDPAIALYRSCGFEEVARDYAWTKPA